VVEIGEPADLGLAKEAIADGSEVEASFTRAGEARDVTLADGPRGIATGDWPADEPLPRAGGRGGPSTP